jgi:hypothetical protein
VTLRACRSWLAVLCALGSGCISVTTVQKELPPDPKTPARLQGESAPALEPTQVEGVQRAAIETPDVYYHAAKERWFRFALDGWFVAFLWNGQWFPVEKGELPPEMAALEPTRTEKKERRLTRSEELRKIEEELRRIEEEERKAKQAPAPDGSSAPPP